MKIMILLVLSGCLYVDTTGEPMPDPQPGLFYNCTFIENGVPHAQLRCGPPGDPAYVVNHFDPPSDPSTTITCAGTPDFCLYIPEE